MRVHELIRRDLADIVNEWATAARTEVPPDAEAPRLVLLDHLPDLLRQLADWLQSEGDHTARDYWDEARKHALTRLDMDFELREVIHEYNLLRCVLLRRIVALSRAGDFDCLEDVARMDQAVDRAMAEAADRFSMDRERTLLAETERSGLALDAAAMGSWDWRPKDGLLKWDARARELLGVSPDAPVSYDVFLSALHPDDRARVDASIQGRLHSGDAGDRLRIEYRTRGVGGAVERWLEARGRVVTRDEHGCATRFIGTVLDVTEPKRAERDLARMAEFRERFLGMVSHDLRNPLNAIRMAATVLVKSEELAPSLARNVGRIIANADRMARMISDLLDLTCGRLGGGIPVQPAPANLEDIVPDVVENLALSRPGRDIVCQRRGHLAGEWDKDRLAQAVGNVIANALDHGAPTSPVRVDLLGEEDDRVFIAVHNDGAPIPTEEQAHIFEPFRRGPRVAARGLGLGLFIASEIVRAHGGQIAVTSSAGQGTTFRLVLPRVRPPSSSPGNGSS